MSNPAPGWYADPNDPALYRWWNGEDWTDETTPVESEEQAEETAQYEAEESVSPTPVEPVAPRAESMPTAPVSKEFVPEKTERSADGSDPDIILTSMATEEAAETAGRTQYLTGFHENYAPPRPAKQKVLIGAGAVLGVALLGIALVAGVFFLFSGKGAQPDAAMPATTIGYVKIDLNPTADQKINLIRLLRTFPRDDMSPLTDTDSLGSIIEQFLTSTEAGITAEDVTWDSVNEWMGDRAALAAIPDAEGLPTPVFIVAVDNEEALKAFLTKNAPDAHYAMVRDGYAVIAESEASVESVKSATQWLTDDPSYRATIGEAGSGQVLSGWIDLNRIQKPTDLLTNGETILESDVLSDAPAVTGVVTFGLNVEPDMLDWQINTNNVTINGAPLRVPAAASNDLASLPADTLAALSWTNAGGFLAQYVQSNTALTEDFQSATGSLLSDVLDPFSSTVTAFVLPADNADGTIYGARVVETEEASMTSWLKLLGDSSSGSGYTITNFVGKDATPYLVIAETDTLAPVTERLSATTETLGANPSFQRVIPSPAPFTFYLNTSGIWEIMKKQDPASETYESLTAFGTTTEASSDGNGTVSHFRLLFALPQ